MKIGIPKERFPGENRVALIPAALPPLIQAGCEVIVETGAGQAAGFPDAAYSEKGARIAATRGEIFSQAEFIAQVRALAADPERSAADLERVRRGQIIAGLAEPYADADLNRRFAEKGASVLAMELVPRISRAQSMDALSSMATLAGYKAVLLAAEALPKLFPMMMTAAGTLSPAKVLIIGVGVAGLQAIATARRLGAVVEAYDVRPAVKEQVESLGAKFVVLDLKTEDAEGKGGYAKAQSEEFYRRQQELMAEVIARQDVVITTAAVPGKKAPVLVTAVMARRLAPGSVIVDLAAERGGNCELTRPGETIEDSGIKIIGPVNLPASVPLHASQMYAKNISTLILHLLKNGGLQLNVEDEIVRETLLCHNGEVVHAGVRQVHGLPPVKAT